MVIAIGLALALLALYLFNPVVLLFAAAATCVLALAILYLALPLVLWNRTRISLNAEVTPLDPSGPGTDRQAYGSNDARLAPDIFWEFAGEASLALLPLGYRPVGAVRREISPDIAASLISVFVHDSLRTLCFAMAAPTVRYPAARFAPAIVFTSVLDSGIVIETTNLELPVQFARLLPGWLVQWPGEKNVARLARLHADLLRRALPARAIPIDPAADAAALVRREHRAAWRRPAVAGLMREDVRRAVWRPTLPAAASMTWSRLWPIAHLQGARLAREAAAMQQLLDRDQRAGIDRSLDALRAEVERKAHFPLLGVAALAPGLVLGVIALNMSLGGPAWALLGTALAWTSARSRGRLPGWRTVLAGGLVGTAGLVASLLVVAVIARVPASGIWSMIIEPALEGGLLPALIFSASLALVVGGYRAIVPPPAP